MCAQLAHKASGELTLIIFLVYHWQEKSFSIAPLAFRCNLWSFDC